MNLFRIDIAKKTIKELQKCSRNFINAVNIKQKKYVQQSNYFSKIQMPKNISLTGHFEFF